jgi:hypothetical protein
MAFWRKSRKRGGSEMECSNYGALRLTPYSGLKANKNSVGITPYQSTNLAHWGHRYGDTYQETCRYVVHIQNIQVANIRLPKMLMTPSYILTKSSMRRNSKGTAMTLLCTLTRNSMPRNSSEVHFSQLKIFVSQLTFLPEADADESIVYPDEKLYAEEF